MSKKINISTLNPAAMTRIFSSKHRAASEANHRLHRRRAIATLVGARVIAVEYATTYLIKEFICVALPGFKNC